MGLVLEPVQRFWLRGSGTGEVAAAGWAVVQRFGVGVLPHGEGFEVPVRELLIRHGTARLLVTALSPPLPRQSPTVALALRRGGGKAGDFGNLAPITKAPGGRMGWGAFGVLRGLFRGPGLSLSSPAFDPAEQRPGLNRYAAPLQGPGRARPHYCGLKYSSGRFQVRG